MGATFSRLKNWIAETLTYADLNAEIDNILNNLTPSGMDDYSTNAAAMRLNTSPGTAGSESLATSLAGEIERLRYVILRMLGSSATYWYDAPTATLTNVATLLSTSVANRIASGRVRAASYANSQPIFLVPSGTAASVVLKGDVTSFQYYVNNSAYIVSSAVTVASLSTQSTANATCLVNLPAASGQAWTKLLGEYCTSLPVDTMGTSISALIGKVAAFKTGTEYFIANVESSTKLSKVQRGFFFDSSDAPISRAAISDNDTISLMKLTWIHASTAGTLQVSYTEPTIGSQPSVAATDDYWYDTANSKWKKYNSGTWSDSNTTLIGVCCQDTANTVAARSFDFAKAFLPTNSVKVKQASNSTVVADGLQNGINVYGIPLNFFPVQMTWDMATDLDSGITEAANTMYYMYVKETGKTVISNIPPYDRTGDLLGLYHPHSAWRCVGQAWNDSSQNLTAVISYDDVRDDNYRVTTSESAGALTVELHGHPMNKFKLPAANGADVQYPILSKQEITVPNTATLGHSSGNPHPIHLYGLDGTGFLLPAVSTVFFKQTNAITASAISAAANSNATLYGAAAATSVACIPLAYMSSSQAAAGVYSTAVVDIKKWPFKPIPLNFSYKATTAQQVATATGGSSGTIAVVVDSKKVDNYNCYLTNSFVAPRPMNAIVLGKLSIDNQTANHVQGNQFNAGIFVNGTEVAAQTLYASGNDTLGLALSPCDSLSLATGDIVNLRIYHNVSTSVITLASAVRTELSVSEVGETT